MTDKKSGWEHNEVRSLVLFSLILQTVLIVTGNRRKYTKWLKFVVWPAYQLADSVATFTLGVLSRTLGDSTDKFSKYSSYTLMAFWAPFLLVHLGGPDTITAYALADNELWLRHWFWLFVQTATAIYVLVISWKGYTTNILALITFIPGLIKYGERSWVLYSASRDRFRKSIISGPDPGPNFTKFMDEYVAKKAEGYIVSLGRAIDVSQVVHRPPTIAENESIPSLTTLNDAFYFFKIFKRLFADLILSFQDLRDSQSFFKKVSWDRAFSVIEVELGLIYDIFYTKAQLVHSPVGFFLRSLSAFSTLAVFITFLVITKDEHSKVDLLITYTLSAGALALEIYAILILASSDWMIIRLSDSQNMSFAGLKRFGLIFVSGMTEFFRSLVYLENFQIPRWPESRVHESRAQGLLSFAYNLGSILRFLHMVPAEKRWSDTMGKYNFFSVCLDEKPAKCIKVQKIFGVDELLEKFRYQIDDDVPNGLKAFIFCKLRDRITSESEENKDIKFSKYRGDADVLKQLEGFADSKEIEFDQSLLMWHIATDLCYYTDLSENELVESSSGELKAWVYSYLSFGVQSKDDNLKFLQEIGKWLSEYMLYLLIVCPSMLPSGIALTRYKDTMAEATQFFKEKKKSSSSRKDACSKLLDVNTDIAPSEVKGDRSKSVLFDACILAKSLQFPDSDQLSDKTKRWETISNVWVDMLCYAAAKCRWNDHADQLSKGGELLTHVWLLVSHFGMTDQFQISKGFIRAKWLAR